MISLTDNEKEKTLRLIEYLKRLATSRSKVVTNLDKYEDVLWLGEIPQTKECFVQQAKSRNNDQETDGEESDVWISVEDRKEPERPSFPRACKKWIDEQSLKSKTEFPKLRPELTTEVKNPAWRGENDTDESEFITKTEILDDHPAIKEEWDNFYQNSWAPWVESYKVWKKIHDIYSRLFSIYQEQKRLGEESELVLGLGLLTWTKPGLDIHRHLVVADSSLEFESRQGKFVVRSSSDGANLRFETEMLENPPTSWKQAEELLAEAEDDPWDSQVENALQSAVRLLDSSGRYCQTMEKSSSRTNEIPVIEYAPALILRKRSTKGLTEALSKMAENINSTGIVPSTFGDLSEIPPKNGEGSDDDRPETHDDGFDGEIFFPKQSNEEQRKIAEKIRAANGVLVQGPPGTGKSHTIANLICHLLATGKRILVTAKTPRALHVLKGLIPKEIGSLCVNLLGEGLEEQQSLGASVNGILVNKDQWDETKKRREREELQQKLQSLREEKARTERKLREIREAESYIHTPIENSSYRGTAAQIAKAINNDRNEYEWFTDKVPLGLSITPLMQKDLQSILIWLRRSTPEKRDEWRLSLPNISEFPSAQAFSDLVALKNETDEEESLLCQKQGNVSELFSLTKADDTSIESIKVSLVRFLEEWRRLSALRSPWIQDALRDVVNGASPSWRNLYETTCNVVSSIELLVPIADEVKAVYPPEIDVNTLREDTNRLLAHLKSGGKLGWGPFRSRTVKECLYIVKQVRIGGRLCKKQEQISTLADILLVQHESEKIQRTWSKYAWEDLEYYSALLSLLKTWRDILKNSLALETLVINALQNISLCPSLSKPAWAEESQIECLITSCRQALVSRKKKSVNERFLAIEKLLCATSEKKTAHPIVNEIAAAIRDFNDNAYGNAITKWQDLGKKVTELLQIERYLSSKRQELPEFVKQFEQTYEDPCWDTRIPRLIKAGHWAQARDWLGKYIHQDDPSSLAKQTAQLEDEIRDIIAKLASIHAWTHCFSRLKENHQRHMVAWQQSMKKQGKGTGKHAPKYRREAREHLNQCREAVPAWIMPLHRVWDTISPQPGMFDVVVIDEASQCGFESLPLLYLGKKVLIVGDDKQISPEEVGSDGDKIEGLAREYLSDFEHKSSFHIEASLFDQGRRRYGSHQITLREHFRCMPEIIRFSNDLCYRDTPLIPLRQYGPNRLKPVEHVFVKEGYREGTREAVKNQPEAKAIAQKICELCNDNRYAGKTMGVVTLQGRHAQARLIEEQLLECLGSREMESRRLICGDPSSFQGDERHVIFLSLVAAPNEKIGPLALAKYERSFNVAVSRAQDQIFLFHSVTCNDLSPSCMRRKLLEFFENTRPQEIAGIEKGELERKALRDNRSIIKPPSPFESWFEVDVALELLRKGYRVHPQYEVAGKRIDLVVEGGEARLAIECDGDYWHGPDRYEEDMHRQRQLERCGWVFFRVRESSFYANKEDALKDLWQLLEERKVFPDHFFTLDHE